MNAINDFRRELLSSLTVGSFYRIDDTNLSVCNVDLQSATIYGEILEREGTEDVLTVKAYSRACPMGEIGHMHVLNISTSLTPDEFDAAREAGWPAMKWD